MSIALVVWYPAARVERGDQPWRAGEERSRPRQAAPGGSPPTVAGAAPPAPGAARPRPDHTGRPGRHLPRPRAPGRRSTPARRDVRPADPRAHRLAARHPHDDQPAAAGCHVVRPGRAVGTARATGRPAHLATARRRLEPVGSAPHATWTA